MNQESPAQRQERHKRHQVMLHQHQMDKAEARERHRKGFHKTRIIPIQLV
jgi:hypothetical protein